MNPDDRTLRVVVATAIGEENCHLIAEREPRIDLVYDVALHPPMRWPADYAGDPSWRRSPQQQRAFEEMVDSADALFGVPDVDPAALRRTVDANPRLRWVHTMAAGGGALVKAADLTRDQLRRVSFTTSAGVHGGPLAEFAVFGVLAGAKSLGRLMDQKRRREWSDRWTMRQVEEMTVLVVGLGGIGREVARRLSALGATVVGTSRSGRPVEHVQRVFAVDRLAEEVGQVDAIVVAVPGTTATDHLIAGAVLDAVKVGTVLVNVGRGSVVDEDGLLRALHDGRIGFAALDVFDSEPLASDSPLWDEPNVVISPHTAALHGAEETRIAELFADNATRLLERRDLLNRVDTGDFY